VVTAVHRLRLRDSFLPDSGQTYLELPGIRPDRGACPGCKAAEAFYCRPDCIMVDPYALDNAARLGRCIVCSIAAVTRAALHEKVILNQRRTVRHLIEVGGKGSLCHMVWAAKGGMVINGCKW
jgi:hypothetical protein